MQLHNKTLYRQRKKKNVLYCRLIGMLLVFRAQKDTIIYFYAAFPVIIKQNRNQAIK